MKKKFIIPFIFCLVLIIGVVWYNIRNNKIVSTITLDINPSIEISLDRSDKVIDVKALNDDAKSVIIKEYNNKTLDEFFDLLVTNLIDKGFIEENDVDTIIYSEGNIKNEDIIAKVDLSFEKKRIHTEIIVVDKVTNEDKELAKKYNISFAKAAYINSITKENSNINIDNLADKSVKELNNTKITGNYCDEGYILDGDKCLKEINRVSATNGDVCPRGYFEYEGKCYEEIGIIDGDKYICNEAFTLENSKCKRTITQEPEVKYSCEIGELTYDPKGLKQGITPPICVDKSSGKAPTQRCLTINHTMINGKCADGPKPTINGECVAGDYLVNGGCYTIDNEDQWVCTDGRIYEKSKGTYTELCPETLNYSNPTIVDYTCQDDYVLKNKKCIKEEIEDAQKERVCPSGYLPLNNERCINYNKTANKENGLICEGDNVKLKGKACITYEVIEAKHN